MLSKLLAEYFEVAAGYFLIMLQVVVCVAMIGFMMQAALGTLSLIIDVFQYIAG
jgi:hypothetical protein